MRPGTPEVDNEPEVNIEPVQECDDDDGDAALLRRYDVAAYEMLEYEDDDDEARARAMRARGMTRACVIRPFEASTANGYYSPTRGLGASRMDRADGVTWEPTAGWRRRTRAL